MADQDHTISRYDRLYSNMNDVALKTKPSTVRIVESLTGRAETFVVQTMRNPDLGDFIFIEVVNDAGIVRVALPPKVANVIASQKDSLTARSRSIASKAVAQARKDRGELPGFMKHKKK